MATFAYFFNNAFYSITACETGGYLLTGSLWIHGRTAILLLRLDELGNVLWSQIYNDFIFQVGSEVVECETGGYAIIGYATTDWEDFDAILIRTDEDGDLTWAYYFGGTHNDRGLAVVECQDGGFAFAGYSTSYGFGNSDVWLVRTDDQGSLLWNHTFGGTDDDLCYSLVETGDHGFVLAGTTESFGAGNEDVWIIRTDSMGNTLWNQTYGSYRRDFCYDIIRKRSGGFTFVGTTDNTATQLADGFVQSIYLDGTLQWNTTFGYSAEDGVYSITECDDGGYAVTGYVTEYTSRQPVTNLWLVRLDISGEVIWNKSYGGLENDEGRSIIQTQNGDFLIAGITESFADFGSEAWALRTSDIPPPPETNQIRNPPNIYMVGLGFGLAIVMLLFSYAMFYKSQNEIRSPWITPSEPLLRNSFLEPRFIDELRPILKGMTKCIKCGAITEKAQLRCSKCSAHLHLCIFCHNFIVRDDLVVFCPSCSTLAHQHHMLNWLKRRNFCPQCGLHFQKHCMD